MPLPQKGPRKGAGNRRVHFPFISTPKGYSWSAWIAGPCHWFDCHSVGRTKPCLCEMTNGELFCTLDHVLDEPRTIGYQPVYARDNGRPGFVIVYDYAREQIDGLKLHHQVTITRGKGKSDTVSIVYTHLNLPLYQSSREDLMRPADLTESLLRIWKIPELVEWYRRTHGLSDTPVSPPTPKVVPPETTPYKAPPDKIPFPAGELADLMEQTAKRALDRAEQSKRNAEFLRQHQVKANGKHDKK